MMPNRESDSSPSVTNCEKAQQRDRTVNFARALRWALRVGKVAAHLEIQIGVRPKFFGRPDW